MFYDKGSSGLDGSSWFVDKRNRLVIRRPLCRGNFTPDIPAFPVMVFHKWVLAQ